MSESKYSALVAKLDGVGEKKVAIEPGDRVKTPFGALCTTIWRLIFLTLIILNFIKLISGTKIVVDGNNAVFNIKPDAPSEKQLDYPPMDWVTENSITFFEKGAMATIQRFDFEDMNGYSKPYQTSGDLIPVEQSVYQRFEVPLHQFVEQVAPILGPRGTEGSITMKEIVAEAVNFKFRETLKVFYLNGEVFESTSYLFNHQASLYMRIPSTQLARIKPCMLQIIMANNIELSYLNARHLLQDRSFQDPASPQGVKTLATDSWTWDASRSFKATDYTFKSTSNLMELKVNFTQADMAAIKARPGFSSLANSIPGGLKDTEFLNWRVGVNYVNNFVHTFNEYKCADEPIDNKFFPSSKILTYAQGAIPLNGVATSFSIALCPNQNGGLTNCLYNSEIQQGQEWITNRGGFDMVLTGWQGQERVRVTALSNAGVFTISRGTPAINFANAFNLQQFESSSAPPTPPTTWTCTEDKYAAGDGCDCDCGAFDPDCLYQNPGQPTKGCGKDQYCLFNRECSEVQFTRFPNNGTYTTTLYVSQMCSRIFKAGDMETVGFFGVDSIKPTGTKTGNCPPCPGDTIYKGLPQRNKNGQYVCNFAASGTINGLTEGAKMQTPAGAPTYIIDVDVGQGSGFPTDLSLVNAGSVDMQISAGTPHQQQAKLTAATAKTAGKQTLTFQILGGGLKTIQSLSHTAQGKIMSFFSDTSNYVVVAPVNFGPNGMEQPAEFPSAGPYPVKSNDSQVNFIAARVGKKNDLSMQLITLAQQPTSLLEPQVASTFKGPPPTNARGLKGTLKTKIKKGSGVNITVNLQDYPLRSWTGLTFPVDAVFWGATANDFNSAEKVTVAAAYRDHLWTCDYGLYDIGDGICDCNCGVWDPDCNDMTQVIEAPARLRNCGTGTNKFCNFDGTCGTGNQAAMNARPGSPPEPYDQFPEVIKLIEPPNLTHGVGSVVETFLSGNQKEGDRAVAFLSPTIKLARTDKPYNPQDRYKQHTYENFDAPERLTMDGAIFITPTKKALTAADPYLCPKLNTTGFVTGGLEGFTKWQVKNHTMELTGCKVTNPAPTACTSIDAVPKGRFRNKCIRDMPPTAVMSWTQTMPINDVWDISKGTVSEKAEWVSSVQEPETSFEFRDTFHFMYDPDAEDVNTRFASNVKTGGDYNQDGEQRYYNGALDYRGLGAGISNTPKVALIPANPPYLKSQLHLRLRSDALKSIMEQKPTDWPTTEAALKTLLEKNFTDTSISFQLTNVGGYTDSQTIPLEPGHLYTMEADVIVKPKYVTDVLDSKVMTAWQTVVQRTAVSRTKLDYFQRSQTRVRWVLNLDGNAVQLKERFAYDFKNFVDGFGSALGLIGLAVVFVKLYQKFKPAPLAKDDDDHEMENFEPKTETKPEGEENA